MTISSVESTSSFVVRASHIQQAYSDLQAYISPSPLIFNLWLSRELGCEVFLKLENLQPIGSFKIRGATYKISHLLPHEKKKGSLQQVQEIMLRESHGGQLDWECRLK